MRASVVIQAVCAFASVAHRPYAWNRYISTSRLPPVLTVGAEHREL